MDLDTPNFDSVARAYRWMEYFSFGLLLERCRLHFLMRCSQAHHALILGDGDGRFTARLLETNPTVRVDAVDASSQMLAVLRERAQRSCRDADTRFAIKEADIRKFTPENGDYDLVVSHFFLDCLTDSEVAALIKRLSPHLTPNAIWLVSEFAVPEKGWRRFGAQMLIRSLYFAFSFLTRLRVREIPDYAKAFDAKGFLRVDETAYLGGVLITEVWQRPSDSHF